MPFLLKIHKSPEGLIVAVCDSELLGKRFAGDEMVLDISESFFRGKPATVPAIIRALKSGITANIVGGRIVEVLVKKGLLNGRNAKAIQNVKYAHIYRV